MLIQREASLVVAIDVQEKLAPAIFEGDRVIGNSVRLLQGAHQLGVPAFVTEHCAAAIGHTLPVIGKAAPAARILAKTHFSCAAEPGIADLLRNEQRPQAILCGMECHVCVLQSAFGLAEAGFEVFVVADAASSRTPENRHLGIERMRAAGIRIVSTEMVLFEWLHRAGTDEFRALLPLIR